MVWKPVSVVPPTIDAPAELSVNLVAKLCAVVPEPKTVGVWKMSEETAPAPVPLPDASVKLPPVLSVPVMPLQAVNVWETAAPLTSIPNCRTASLTLSKAKLTVELAL